MAVKVIFRQITGGVWIEGGISMKPAPEMAIPPHETLVAAVSPAPSELVVQVAMSDEVGRASHAAGSVRSLPVALFVQVAAWLAVAENAMTSAVPRNKLSLNFGFMGGGMPLVFPL
jgi:hypothetical protein